MLCKTEAYEAESSETVPCEANGIFRTKPDFSSGVHTALNRW